jgi:hypothetical protein
MLFPQEISAELTHQKILIRTPNQANPTCAIFATIAVPVAPTLKELRHASARLNSHAL